MHCCALRMFTGANMIVRDVVKSTNQGGTCIDAAGFEAMSATQSGMQQDAASVASRDQKSLGQLHHTAARGEEHVQGKHAQRHLPPTTVLLMSPMHPCLSSGITAGLFAVKPQAGMHASDALCSADFVSASWKVALVIISVTRILLLQASANNRLRTLQHWQSMSMKLLAASMLSAQKVIHHHAWLAHCLAPTCPNLAACSFCRSSLSLAPHLHASDHQHGVHNNPC